MEIDKKSFADTDLDDDDDEIDLPRLSFDRKIALHRTNRLDETFGQINLPFLSNKHLDIEHEVIIPIDSENFTNQIERYEYCCHRLDITIDWQIRALLAYNHITIYNRAFSFNDIRAFSTAIGQNLENLTLASAGLTTRTIEVLCQGLKKCTRLNLLDLSDNKLVKSSFNTIIQTVEQLPSLRYLSLANCSIQDSYGKKIGDLCRNKKLLEINLSGNEFEEISCILIGGALTENLCLTYFNLSWNHIRSYASIAIFRGFEINKTLTEFDISSSDLGYDGSVALRRVLLVNKVLQRLNVSNCSIDWTCAKLIGQGLQKNSTLKTLNLASNPLTTHGIQHIVTGISSKRNTVSLLDLSGLTVFSETVRLAKKIAKQREFTMKYEFETPMHDILGRTQITKADSMRRIIQDIDSRNWRPLDYYRILDSRKRVRTQNDITSFNITANDESKPATQQDQFIDRLVEPLTFKNLTMMITQQRLRDRSIKQRQEQQEKNVEKRNEKILQTVTQHFPDIDIISKQERHQRAIEQLAKPRTI